MEPTDAAADETFLLDLLNSTPIVDGVQQDLLDTSQAGRSWLRAHGHSGSPAELQAARAARSTLQAVVRGQGPAGSLAPLLDGISYRPSISDQDVQWRLETPTGRTAAARAVLAWDTLRRTRPGRLRPCENPECALFLIDHSKPNKTRWCSMAVCGNRTKARRHYERSRASR
ncbi:MAG TPA: CGNR zinc finger domain-containing protein [Actinopolymorphaceae bacterium]|nr:CGNR zinc finger domain-containing protein [Actinopolymorphaceae bacterium]